VLFLKIGKETSTIDISKANIGVRTKASSTRVLPRRLVFRRCLARSEFCPSGKEPYLEASFSPWEGLRPLLRTKTAIEVSSLFISIGRKREFLEARVKRRRNLFG